MFTTISLIKRKSSCPAAEFQERWRRHYGSLVGKVPGLLASLQDLVLEQVARVGEDAGVTESVDGFLQLRFENQQSWDAYIEADLSSTLQTAASDFVEDERIALVDQHEVIPAPRDAPFKRMSLVRRHQDLSLEQFLHEWRKVHATMVRSMPKVLGYRQSVIVERRSALGNAIGYDRLPFDGIVELWFDSPEAMAQAYASDAGQSAVAHVRRTVSDMQAFRVATV